MIDQKYIDGLKAGDEGLVRELYSRNLPKLIGWIRTKGGAETDAHDMFQDAMEAVLALIYKEDFRIKSSIEGLILRIAKHKWIDKIRQNVKDEKVRNELSLRPDHDDDYDVLGESMQSQHKIRHMLDETFKHISPLCQQLLKLIESGSSTAEVAQQLKMASANTVYRRKFACLEAWRHKIENHQYYQIWKSSGL